MDAALARRPSLVATDTTLPAAQTSTAKASHVDSIVERLVERYSMAIDIKVEDKAIWYFNGVIDGAKTRLGC